MCLVVCLFCCQQLNGALYFLDINALSVFHTALLITLHWANNYRISYLFHCYSLECIAVISSHSELIIQIKLHFRANSPITESMCLTHGIFLDVWLGLQLTGVHGV